ncbi:unnamed protein product, partial [Chrysoparadoxa australica]
NFNIIQEAIALLSEVVRSPTQLRMIIDSKLAVFVATVQFLIEAVQGPCAENQLSVADSSAIDVCKLVLAAQFTCLANPVLGVEAKAMSVKLMASCLEGRKDRLVHHQLAQKIEVNGLHQMVIDVHATHILLKKKEDSKQGKDKDKEDAPSRFMAEAKIAPTEEQTATDNEEENEDEEDKEREQQQSFVTKMDAEPLQLLVQLLDGAGLDVMLILRQLDSFGTSGTSTAQEMKLHAVDGEASNSQVGWY